MILRRLGNKKKIAHKIIQHFPNHKTYIEPFWGTGSIFFSKPKAKYNIVNDLDSDVFNLFQVLMNQKSELEQAFYITPHHYDLFEYWENNKETEPIKKALRFLMLSNFSYMGKSDCMLFGSAANNKKILYNKLKLFNDELFDVQFCNKDFKDFFNSISFDDRGNAGTKESFIYADPPYINTADTYSDSDTWIEKDSNDLFNALEETGCKYAMSEFDNPFILNQAKERKLNVIIIGERQNLKNRRTEILITNYKNIQKELF